MTTELELEELYKSVMQPQPDLFTAYKLFTLRIWDGMDGCWADCMSGTKGAVLKQWAKDTKNGTVRTSFQDIDYYCIFPAGTKMVWDGSEGREMFR